MSSKPKFTQVFANSPAVNWLSAARFFLFGARDVWFVVALPVFLYSVLGWSFSQVGAFMALWVIGYGVVQAAAPSFINPGGTKPPPGGATARGWALVLALVPAGIAVGLTLQWPTEPVLVGGLILFGIVFALNSVVHSYLILAYSDFDKVALNVGFYYMANAGGRPAGTVFSGLIFQTQGLIGCLWWSAGFILIALLRSSPLPPVRSPVVATRWYRPRGRRFSECSRVDSQPANWLDRITLDSPDAAVRWNDDQRFIRCFP